MMSTDPGVVDARIVAPAWNGEDRRARTLDRCVPALECRSEPFEVLVVVDGIRALTAEGARTLEDPHVRGLEFPTQLGKGGAILEWMRASRDERVGYRKADGPIAPREMHGLVGCLKDVDFAAASRWTLGAAEMESEPQFHRFPGVLGTSSPPPSSSIPRGTRSVGRSSSGPLRVGDVIGSSPRS